MRYTTRDEARQQVINALGEHADQHDIDAITDATYTYRVDTDPQGNELVNTAGFEQTITTDEFWTTAARHAIA